MLSGSVPSSDRCHLPINVNPFDESVAKYIKILPKNINCKLETDPNNNLTLIDENGFLKQTNNQFKYPINGISMSNNSFVSVECSQQKSNQLYRNTHFWFPINKTGFNSELNNNTDRPSVLILVIESLSRINFLRFMSKTKESIEKFGNIVYMKGLNKLADNSFPNMVPFLTGKRVWNNELQNEDFGPYDDWPFIWKNFSKSGYKTSLIEDFPDFTLFNYESKGFMEKPTDFYPRPFWIHLFRDVSRFMIGLMPFNLNHCYNERMPKINIFLQQIQHFINQCKKHFYPYFTFAFYIEVTHNDFNRVQLIDSHISNFLEKSDIDLNNTLLILMGDHGNRFGSILQTVVGRIEERMPLLAIRIPDNLNKRYPHLLNNLKTNSEKLMTWLDFHQLLTDIINHNYTEISNSKPDSHYYSPWRQSIPDSRSCQNSLIPENYCVCDIRKKINISENIVTDASHALIAHINGFLNKNKCHDLVLNSILESELIFPSGSTAKPKGFEQRIEIMISVNPSKAIFRAQLFRTARTLKWLLKGEVNRLNKYGNQSDCIHERRLKPFCFCCQ